MIKQYSLPVASSIMLHHCLLYIGLQSPSPQSQFSSSTPADPLPIRSTVLPHLSVSVSSLFLIDSRIEPCGQWGREGAGSCNLSQSVASSPDSRGYQNLSTVEVGLPVVCLCQRFDRLSPTLNTCTPQPSLFRPIVKSYS